LIASKLDDASKITVQSLTALGITDSLAQSIMDSSLREVGASLSTTDLGAIRTLAGTIEQLYVIRRELEKYVESMMQVVAPNLTVLVGPVVGARLISLAGSLRDLARRPSSTVQVFGAEKALFRSLKTGTDPPKHGVIFQVPEIYSAPYWQRGKIARALAGKVAIAARVDAFSKRNLGESIRGDLLRRIEEIRQHNPEEPPPKPPRPPKKLPTTSRRAPRQPRKSASKRRGGGRS
jgi:nucleolar protein 56